MAENLHKVRFELVQDEDGYPPYTSEAMWCVQLDDHRFRLDNIPFFVTGVSYGDVIAVLRKLDGGLSFAEVLEEHGHSTLRVMFLETASDNRSAQIRADELGKLLREKGCLTRVSPSPQILAIDVPPPVLIADIQDLLSRGEEDGLWSYDEGTLAHSR